MGVHVGRGKGRGRMGMGMVVLMVVVVVVMFVFSMSPAPLIAAAVVEGVGGVVCASGKRAGHEDRHVAGTDVAGAHSAQVRVPVACLGPGITHTV